MTPVEGGFGSGEWEAARLVLAKMGLAPQDLLGTAPPRPPAPTFAEYLPTVAAAVSDGTRRVYRSYWNRVVEHWGHRRIDEPTDADESLNPDHQPTCEKPRSFPAVVTAAGVANPFHPFSLFPRKCCRLATFPRSSM